MRFIPFPDSFQLSSGRAEEECVHSSGNPDPKYSPRISAARDFMNLLMN